MKSKNLIALIVALTLSAALIFVTLNGLGFGDTVLVKPVSEALSLGLDLRGGVYTVFRAEKSGEADEEKCEKRRDAARKRWQKAPEDTPGTSDPECGRMQTDANASKWMQNKDNNGIITEQGFCSTSTEPGASLEGIIGSNSIYNKRYKI